MYICVALNCFLVCGFFTKTMAYGIFSGVQRSSRKTERNRDSAKGFCWTWSTTKSGDIVGNTCQEPARALQQSGSARSLWY